MTLRELCTEVIGLDEPLECSFVIAATLRHAVQGKPSTFEGECASVLKASEHFDVKSREGIEKWLADLGSFADFDFPPWWFADMVNSAEADERNEEEDWDLDYELNEEENKAMNDLPPDFAQRIIDGYRARFNEDGTFEKWIHRDEGSESR